jgi:O-antigen/teichoic acid export membrane protein
MLNLLNTLKTHPGVRKYSENIGWQFLEKGFRAILTLFVGIWMIRYLGPEKFGLLSYAQSVGMILITITGLGLDNIIVKELISGEANKEYLLGTSLLIRLLVALVLLICLSIVLLNTRSGTETNSLIFIISLCSIFSSFTLISNYFQSLVLSKYAVFASIFAFSIASIIKITLILLKAPLVAFAISNLIEYFLISVSLIYFYQKFTKTKLLSWRFDTRLAIRLLKYTWPLTIAVALAVVFDSINQIMIKLIINDEAVGHYVAASRLTDIMFFTGAVVVSTFFPAILNAKIQDSAKYERRMQRLLDLLVMMAILTTIPVFIFSDELTQVIYGKAYIDSARVLAFLAISTVFVFMRLAAIQWLIVNNLQNIVYYQNGLAIMLNILLNLFLIPLIGIKGAAISYIITYVVAFYISLSVFKSTRHLFTIQSRALFFCFIYRKESK